MLASPARHFGPSPRKTTRPLPPLFLSPLPSSSPFSLLLLLSLLLVLVLVLLLPTEQQGESKEDDEDVSRHYYLHEKKTAEASIFTRFLPRAKLPLFLLLLSLASSLAFFTYNEFYETYVFIIVGLSVNFFSFSLDSLKRDVFLITKSDSIVYSKETFLSLIRTPVVKARKEISFVDTLATPRY